jgi:hypothetical protein
MAAIGFKGFGWILSLATVAPSCYLVSSAVAAERGRVEAVDRAIIQAKRDIRGLETEFGTRANLAQLEQWNGDLLALAAPRPDQYVAGEAQVASLGVGASAELKQAALIVPAGVPQPVPAVAEAMPAAPSPAVVATAAATVKHAVSQGKAQAVAMLDRKLLSESTIGDLVSGARHEAVSLR